MYLVKLGDHLSIFSLHSTVPPLTLTLNIVDRSLTSTAGSINGQYPTWLSVKRSAAWSSTEVAGFDRIYLIFLFVCFNKQQHPVCRLLSTVIFQEQGLRFVGSQFPTRTSMRRKKLMKEVKCRFQWMDEGLPWWHAAAAADNEESDMPA